MAKSTFGNTKWRGIPGKRIKRLSAILRNRYDKDFIIDTSKTPVALKDRRGKLPDGFIMSGGSIQKWAKYRI